MSQSLIAALQKPGPLPASRRRVPGHRDPHFLGIAHWAIRLQIQKKPVNFGFLDFTSLEARKHFCGEELRLNQRLTQDLYLDVLPITGSAEAPQLGSDGPAIEYALKMRQFPQSELLSTLQANGELTTAHIDEMAAQIAQFHLSTPKVSAEKRRRHPAKRDGTGAAEL
nr:hypothetical protein GCM10020185_46710 [Pseudomonas brassicacearum subsp. brassicacearum]